MKILQKYNPAANCLGDRGPVAQALGDRGLDAKPPRGKFESRAGGGPVAQALGGRPPVADRGPAAKCLGDRPPRPYIRPPPPLGGSFETSKIQKKRREVRRSEAAKPCWIPDLQSSGN